jgi:hypothetical protein
MANIFLNLPMPVGDGAGASVDTSAMGTDKTIVIGGEFTGSSVAIEVSTDGVSFNGVYVFTSAGKKVLSVAAQFMRIFVRGRSAEPFSATANMGANDSGALFFSLPLPAGDGAGTPVDVSTQGNFTTFAVSGDLLGAGIAIQVSEDGVDYATCQNFSGVGGIGSKVVVANWMRTFVSGRVGNSHPFTAVVAVGATVDAGGGGGGGGITIPHIIQTGDGTASAGADAAVVIADGDLLGGIAADVSATGSGAFAMGAVASAPGYTTSILASGAGAFAGGSGANGATIEAKSPGSFAQGFVDGTGSISTRATFASGAFAQGYANNGAYIYARAQGCFAQGRAVKVGAIDSYITSDSGGSFAQGAVYNGAIRAWDEGCFAQGYARGGVYDGYIEAGGRGSFAQGQAQYGYIRASFLGSFAQGDAGYGSYIVCSGSGGFAQGHSGTYAKIRCNREGGFAQGFADRGDIYCRADGGHASGYVDGTSANLARIWCDLSAVGAFAHGSVRQSNGAFTGRLNAEEPGSVAMGRVVSTTAAAEITAGSDGSFALGYALNGIIRTGLIAQGAFAQGSTAAGGLIFSDALGAFAQGHAPAAGTIAATAINAAQFGPGTNAQADSLKVGVAGLALKGTVGAPAVPVDGNIWMVGTAAMLKTDGATGKIALQGGVAKVVGISMCDGLIGYGNMAQYANFAGSLGNWFSLAAGGTQFVNFTVPVKPGDVISAVKIWGTSGGSAGDELQAKLFTGIGNSSAQLSTTKTSGLVSGLDDIEWTGADASLPYTVLSATRVVISVRLPATTFISDVTIFGIDVTIA